MDKSSQEALLRKAAAWGSREKRERSQSVLLTLPASYSLFLLFFFFFLIPLPLNRTPTYIYPPTLFLTSSSWHPNFGWHCMLPAQTQKNSVQDSICLQVLRREETQSVASNRYPPCGSLLRAFPTWSRHLEANPSFEDFCSAQEYYLGTANPSFLIFLVFGLGPIKSRERDIRKKPQHYFPIGRNRPDAIRNWKLNIY